ncbi:MAG TPA: hypothetical protein VGQ99_22365 [Tepidisphaeraceae bacterium]|nr:hypothetical protein [Tepidisphaeraceae bacterium]
MAPRPRYHGYDDKKNTDDNLDFSEQWIRAVHRALKSTCSFYSAALLDRQYVGIDQSQKYVNFARKRLKHAQTLP